MHRKPPFLKIAQVFIPPLISLMLWGCMSMVSLRMDSGHVASLQIPPVWAQTNVRIVLRDGGIQPVQIETAAGEAVHLTVVNEGLQVHNLVIPDFYVFLPNLSAGEQTTASFTPSRAGRFPYYSDKAVNGRRQPEPGMQGTLIVR
ncbi:MAG: cupredoxin domain-containing protein [Alicyclobacillus herbarius]|uniref:cupredoxin domain-containing protein n=1 Tax=Alicyclobacillus herbarius TaxID=122960 RepID=UPI00041143EA|nr:cupredoxin domain-containing protein [Alicyclobacillus herbarius]MCL6631532.1 cupredoxin domain-containing protein [Alicyclobacillus herbarius]